MIREDWRALAECAQPTAPARPRDYFANTVPRRVFITCVRCPVIEDCTDEALEVERMKGGRPLSHHYRYGVYGGLTGPQRAKLARGTAEAWEMRRHNVEDRWPPIP